VDRKNGVLFWARVFYSPFVNPSLSSQEYIASLEAAAAAKKAELDALDAGGGGAVAAPSIAPTGPATEAYPRSACFANRDDDAPLFGWRGNLIFGPVRDVQGEELARPRAEQLEDAGPLEVFEAPQYDKCISFIRRMRVAVPAFGVALDAILEANSDCMDRMSSKTIKAALDLFDDLPPEYKPKITMNSEWEAVRGVFNAVRDAAGKPLLSEDEVKSMLENKWGNKWAVKRDVFEEKEMFTGGWRLVDWLVTVEGMVAGNAAKELPPAVRETMSLQTRNQWDKLMPMLKTFDEDTKLLGGWNHPVSKLLSVYRALREHDVQVEMDDDCSILWSKVVSTATRRPVGAEEASELVKRDAVNKPYKINVDAVNGDDVAKVKALLAEVLSRAKVLVREEEKGKGG
jgi:hypothetical protein